MAGQEPIEWKETSNIQHRTSNIQGSLEEGLLGVGCLMFDVRCSQLNDQVAPLVRPGSQLQVNLAEDWSRQTLTGLEAASL
jgi:hypothetical protein